MKLVSAKCPSCGADIDVDKDSESTKCEYCKSKIIVDDAIKKYKLEISGEVEVKNLPKVENLLKLGERHYKDGEYDDAYAQYEKICELEPENYLAVLRKGITKSYITTYANFDIKPASNGMKNAYKILKKEKADKETINESIIECYTMIVQKQNEVVDFYKKNDLSYDGLELAMSRLKMCLGELQYLKDIVEDNNKLKINIINSIITCTGFILEDKFYKSVDRQGNHITSKYKDKNYEMIKKTCEETIKERDTLDPNAKTQYEIDKTKKEQNEKTRNLVIMAVVGIMIFLGTVGAIIDSFKEPEIKYTGIWVSETITIELKEDYSAIITYPNEKVIEAKYKTKCNTSYTKCDIDIIENEEIRMQIKYEEPYYTAEEGESPTFCTLLDGNCDLMFSKNE